jgi:chromosome segregation ATPase
MQLEGIESQRSSTRMALNLIENRFEGLVTRAADLNREGRAVPPRLQSEIDETRSELRKLRADLDRLDEREVNARERFSASLERYRELTSSNQESG